MDEGSLEHLDIEKSPVIICVPSVMRDNIGRLKLYRLELVGIGGLLPITSVIHDDVALLELMDDSHLGEADSAIGDDGVELSLLSAPVLELRSTVQGAVTEGGPAPLIHEGVIGGVEACLGDFLPVYN